MCEPTDQTKKMQFVYVVLTAWSMDRLVMLSLQFFFFFILCVTACIMPVCAPRAYPWRPEEGIQFPGAGIMNGYKPACGARNNSKRSKCSLLLNHLSSPGYAFFVLRCNQGSTKSILLHC